MDSAQEVLKQMGAPVDFEEIYFSEVGTVCALIEIDFWSTLFKS
jgi:hypothetical protein